MDKNNNILRFVGKKIRELRNHRGFSQEELGFRCTLDRSYISDIELGKRNVSLLNIQVIADTLGVHISRLFFGYQSYPGAGNDHISYKVNKSFTIQCGFEVKSEDVEYAATMTSAQLEEFPFTLYQSIDLKSLSGMIGSIFSSKLAERVGALVNPIEKGHPDIIPEYGKNADEEKLRNFPEGLEIKCTVGNVAKESGLKAGQQRIMSLAGITWQAHHREVSRLMGLVIDFAGSRNNDIFFPSITGVFYADDLKTDDWGKISGTTGRNTKVTGMKLSGKIKMGQGWILLLDQQNYISRYQEILSFTAK